MFPFRDHLRGLALLGAVTLIASCDAGAPGATGAGFQSKYHSARSALEAGRHDVAVRRYQALLDGAGPLESRLRLEMSHALLRADRYDEASRQADAVAAAHRDNRRSAALAVVGTAQHRLAQVAMSEGDFGPATIAHLRRAAAAFSEMLGAAPDFDPTGALAQRQAMVGASLENLGG